jgi:hypothetical protein
MSMFEKCSVACLVACLGSTQGVSAATIAAATCSNANVQSAINSAVAGDTVVVPTGNCAWTSTVTWNAKKLTLTGAGIGQTNIIDQSSGGAALIISGASSANFVTVSGFTFIKGADHSEGIVQITGGQDTVGFRFHHNRILQAATGSRGIQVVGVYGLIDHVAFDATGDGSIQSVTITGSLDGTDGGFTPWMRPLTLGTNKAVYVEDSTFTYSNQSEDSIDAYGGARLVVRHNTFNSISLGFHGTDSGNRRSVFSYEIYNNTFVNNSSTTLRGATLRGGTGVIFDNSYGGTSPWYDVTMLVYRACPPLDSSTWQTCNGTNWQLGSTSFSSNASRTASIDGGVRFCSGARDTVCATDSTCSAIGAGTCSTFFDGAEGGGYACRDQVGRTHDQQLSPLYVWNNGSVGAGTYDGGFSCGAGIGFYLQAGRDYVTGSPMPGFTAYMYPHPLAGPGAPPPTPANLRIVR